MERCCLYELVLKVWFMSFCCVLLCCSKALKCWYDTSFLLKVWINSLWIVYSTMGTMQYCLSGVKKTGRANWGCDVVLVSVGGICLGFWVLPGDECYLTSITWRSNLFMTLELAFCVTRTCSANEEWKARSMEELNIGLYYWSIYNMLHITFVNLTYES